MHYKLVIRLLGILIAGLGALMFPSLIVSLIYSESDTTAFLITIGIELVIGLPMIFLGRSKNHDIYPREGFVLVGLGWIVLSLFGALPFCISGYIPNFVSAVFETVSGFTTTGATIIPDVEILPHGLLFWRSFTHWVGGMGVLVLTLALVPRLGSKTLNILRAESPGPNPSKLLPKMRQFAKILYIIYLIMTVLEIGILLLCDMPLFDSIVNAFGTAGTGGFAIKNASIGAYNNPAAEIVIGAFMLLFGINFSVYIALWMRNLKMAFKNAELYIYLAIVAICAAIITINILPQAGSFGTAIRQAGFQVSSIITTTGYATVDFQGWPTLSRSILMFLMVVGACAGSTGGGIKVVRMALLGKSVRSNIYRMLHPRSVNPVKMDGRVIESDTLRGVHVYFFAYVAIIILASLLVSIDNYDFETTFSAVVSATGNVGPGIGLVGPAGNFSIFSSFSQGILSICMLLGRLEIMPVLMLATPSLWRKG